MSRSDNWTLAEAVEDGRHLLYRIRLAAPDFASRRSHARFLVVLWEYEAPGATGMPETDTAAQMTEFENLLMPAIESTKQGFPSVVVTGHSLREWHCYVRDPDETMEIVNDSLADAQTFPVKFDFSQEDPEWAVYDTFLQMLSAGKSGS